MTAQPRKIEDVLACEGFYMGPPVGVSMWPLLRNRTDVMLVVPAPRLLERYDVALYRRGENYVLHRVVDFYEKGYVICGDNCASLEHVPFENVIGKLKGFYRGSAYTECATSRAYHAYSKLWVGLFPARKACKRAAGFAKGAARRALARAGVSGRA